MANVNRKSFRRILRGFLCFFLSSSIYFGRWFYLFSAIQFLPLYSQYFKCSECFWNEGFHFFFCSSCKYVHVCVYLIFQPYASCNVERRFSYQGFQSSYDIDRLKCCLDLKRLWNIFQNMLPSCELSGR